jgi:GNAT superfamily N-acetyltransferase
MNIKVKLLEASHIPRIMSAFLHSEWHTPESHFQAMLTAQEKGEIVFLVAHSDKDIAGFVFIKWQADYPPFAERSIPEIRDLRVLAEFRCRGIATVLVEEAEKRIFARSPVVGIGVGLYADYGPAQRMYILRGYVPDGRGISYKSQPVNPGHDVFVDDDLLLYFIKERRQEI